MPHEVDRAAPAGKVLIEFATPGATKCSVHVEGLNAAQLFVAIGYLQLLAQKQAEQEIAQQRMARPGLIIPRLVGA